MMTAPVYIGWRTIAARKLVEHVRIFVAERPSRRARRRLLVTTAGHFADADQPVTRNRRSVTHCGSEAAGRHRASDAYSALLGVTTRSRQITRRGNRGLALIAE
jgi:hypothetical protein